MPYPVRIPNESGFQKAWGGVSLSGHSGIIPFQSKISRALSPNAAPPPPQKKS